MTKKVGVREISRNPSLLRIGPGEMLEIEDRRAHKTLGLYIGAELAREFERFLRKEKLLQSARKIRESASEEYRELEGSTGDGL